MNKTILIVDDIYENLYLLKVILEQVGYSVIEANDGKEGLEKLHNHNIDLIISDILMPVMDGYMFCQACKKDASFKNIPFVFYTSTYTEKLDEDFALKLGATHFLRKPTEPDVILQLLQKIFSDGKPNVKPAKKENFTEQEVLKLYSKRLISKLEHKNLELENEIKARKKVEKSLIQKNEILDLIAINTPLNEIFDKLLLTYQTLHPNYFGALRLMDEDGIHLDLVSAPSLPKSFTQEIKCITISESSGSSGAAAITKKLVIVSDLNKDKLWVKYKDVALNHKLKSCWSLPIISNNKDVLGVFTIYSKSINTPSSKEIKELDSAISLVKTAIEKSRIVAENRKKDESYKSLINHASDLIITYTFNGDIHTFNKATCKTLGYTQKEFLKLKLQDILVGDVIINAKNYDNIKKGNSVIIERQLKRKDGSIIEVEISAKLQNDGKVLGIARDITERKLIEKKLIESEYHLRQSQVVANIGSYAMNITAMTWESSIVLDEIFGINESYLKNFEGWTALIHPNDKDELITYFKNNILKNHEFFDKEYRIIRADNEAEVWVHGKGELVMDKGGNPIKMIGTIQDITSRKIAKIRLQESEKSLLVAQKLAKIGSFNYDIKTQIVQSSQTYKEIVGVDANTEMTYKLWRTITHPEDTPNNQKTFERCLETGEKFNLEYRIITKDKKELKWIHGIGEVFYENGEATNFIGTIQDITERKQSEIALKAAHEFSDKLITSMQEGLIIVNLEGEILMVNDSTCKILQYNKEELLGMKLPYPFAKSEDFEEINKTNTKVAQGDSPAFQFEFIRKNGEKFWASFLTGNIKNDNGEPVALFGTMKDISEELKAKAVLEENAINSNKKKNVILELASLVGQDLKTSLKKITKLASETLNISRVSVWSYSNNNNEIKCEKLYNLNSNLFEEGKVLKYEDNPNYFDALKKEKAIIIKDAKNDNVTKGFSEDYLNPNNITSLMDVFINSTHGFYGVISFENVGEVLRYWTSDDQEFAISIANIVSLMVESHERKMAENNMVKANEKLLAANKELNKLRAELERENVYLRNELDLVFNYEEMVYGSNEFSEVLNEVEKVAPTNATVLLLGESGTGKELLARAIHNISLRNNKPLIKVNCSAIPRELIESELFGHKKGSFTGAFSDKVGKFELADGGTLFLDEIGELPLDMQPKILRFLQEGEIEVVGGTSIKNLDVRVIAATNRNLKEEIEKKQFREDLYFRLNVFPIEVPPLRKRKDDIPLLVEHFVDKFNKAYGKHIKYVADETMGKLKQYNWPGNIRELENLIERAAILTTNNTLVIPGFESSSQITKQQSYNSKESSLDAVQRSHIINVLEQCNWKISGEKGAAAKLDLKPSTLRDKMAKLNIIRPN
ncbi:sigma 54-interacting transcriptional regulator [Xanthomarina gelatinilytica]|uniref:sigma 54-interacting transcriptional regulator n=1 Tax=Xanthomarina gelatinilytica TaxID=1137281 RepID=UPI003AA7D3F0